MSNIISHFIVDVITYPCVFTWIKINSVDSEYLQSLVPTYITEKEDTIVFTNKGMKEGTS